MVIFQRRQWSVLKNKAHENCRIMVVWIYQQLKTQYNISFSLRSTRSVCAITLFLCGVNTPAWSDVTLPLGNNDPAVPLGKFEPITTTSFRTSNDVTLFQEPNWSNGVRVGIALTLPESVSEPKKSVGNLADGEGWRILTTPGLDDCGLGISFKFSSMWGADGPGEPNRQLNYNGGDNNKAKDLYVSLRGAKGNPTANVVHKIAWHGYASLVKIRQIEGYQSCKVDRVSIPTAAVMCSNGLASSQYGPLKNRNSLYALKDPGESGWACSGGDSNHAFFNGPSIIIPAGTVYVLGNASCHLTANPATTDFGEIAINMIQQAQANNVVAVGKPINVTMQCDGMKIPMKLSMAYTSPRGTDNEYGQSDPSGPVAVAIGRKTLGLKSPVPEHWAIGKTLIDSGHTSETTLSLFPVLVKQDEGSIKAGEHTITGTLTATVH